MLTFFKGTMQTLQVLMEVWMGQAGLTHVIRMSVLEEFSSILVKGTVQNETLKYGMIAGIDVWKYQVFKFQSCGCPIIAD